jgi:hypothetical protein
MTTTDAEAFLDTDARWFSQPAERFDSNNDLPADTPEGGQS